MKTISTHAMYAAAFLLLSVPVSCTKDIKEEPEPEDPSSLVIDQKEVTIPAEGGEGKATYTLDNPKDDLRLEAACTAEWITALDTETEGQITFIADANTTYETRETEVTVKYGEDVTGSFKIIQEGAEKPADFVITVEEATVSSITYGVAPLDKEMTYIHRLLLTEYYEGFASEDAFISEELEQFNTTAAYYGVSLEEFLGNFLVKGDISGQKGERLNPDTPYTLCAYGLSAAGETLTSVSTCGTATQPVEMIDIQFDITASVSGPKTTVTVTPSDNEQRYIYDIIATAEYESYGEDYYDMRQSLLSDMVYMYEDQYGMSHEDAAAAILGSMAFKSVQEKTIELKASTQYTAFAIAVNNDCYFCSEHTDYGFTTGGVEASDNILSITISNVETRIADYSVSASNNDPYCFGVVKSEEFEGLDDDGIIRKLISEYNVESRIKQGSISGRFTDLEPETAYSVFVFGYESGAATTGLSKASFTTTEVVQSDITFRLVLDKYFSGAEFQEMYPDKYDVDISGSAVIPTMVEALPKDRLKVCYYDIYDGDCTDTDALTDEEVIPQLIENGSSWRWNQILLGYDTVYTFIGFSVDIAGNYGKVWRYKVCFTEDGASPIEEYEEYNESLDPWSASGESGETAPFYTRIY